MNKYKKPEITSEGRFKTEGKTVENCNECPWSRPEEGMEDLECTEKNISVYPNDPVCDTRRRFEILRNKVRQLQRENKELMEMICKNYDREVVI